MSFLRDRPRVKTLFRGPSRKARLAVVEREAAALRVTVRAYEDVIRDREATVRLRELTIAEAEAAVVARETVIRDYEQALAAIDAHPAPAAMNSAFGGAVSSDEEYGAAMPVEMSPDHVDRVLDEWRAVAARYAGQGFWGGQALIEPFLVERRIHDRPGYLIMATQESRNWYDNGHDYELPQLLRLGMIRQGDTVFDCGSNQGLNTVSYARAVGPAGRVVAFDPFALHVDIGRFNARLNNIRNADFIRAGVSDKAEQVRVSMEEQIVATTSDAEAAKSISLLPLDTFVSLRPSFVKIDIEGAEINALEGAAEIIATEPAIYIEIHPQFLPRFGRSPMDVFKHVPTDRYRFYIDHPGYPPVCDYDGGFEMTQSCALYCVPRSRDATVRHLHGSRPGV